MANRGQPQMVAPQGSPYGMSNDVLSQIDNVNPYLANLLMPEGLPLPGTDPDALPPPMAPPPPPTMPDPSLMDASPFNLTPGQAMQGIPQQGGAAPSMNVDPLRAGIYRNLRQMGNQYGVQQLAHMGRDGMQGFPQPVSQQPDQPRQMPTVPWLNNPDYTGVPAISQPRTSPRMNPMLNRFPRLAGFYNRAMAQRGR